ncbi:unnamed protein product [Heligmosomoides polygyrus]|uniref:HTH iclR-type domain-containing protein n=1 Tax=Heligmosomoides polygyrus TaxID=6339 RepID=A0A183GUF3_HELPZ|nr:unnamed protein product [Heligmosomoides polygyrus]
MKDPGAIPARPRKLPREYYSGHTQNRQLVLATCGARPDLSVRELSDLTNTPKSTQYMMPFGLLAKSRSCLESYMLESYMYML